MCKKRIFICDDDSTIVDMLEMLFEMSDLETMSETNSSEAYQKIMMYMPDVIVVDLWMPVVSGDELIRKIRSNEELKNVFIICTSASRDGEEVAIRAGADDFLAKPFDIHQMLQKIENFSISR